MTRARAVAVKFCLVALVCVAAAWASRYYSAVYVGGDSMSPTLTRGDLIVIARDTSGVGSGDVVLFEKQGWPAGVVHRVIAVTFDDRLRLKGDANLNPDRDDLPRSSLRGVMVLALPTGRAIAVLEAVVRMV